MSKDDSVYRVWDTVDRVWMWSARRSVWLKPGLAKAAICGNSKVFGRQSRYIVVEFIERP